MWSDELMKVIFKSGPCEAPVRVEGGYPAEYFEGDDVLERLKDVYVLSAEELLRREEGALVPRVYLHCLVDPLTGEGEGGLYLLQTRQALLIPDNARAKALEMCSRVLAERGQAQGAVLLSSAIARTVGEERTLVACVYAELVDDWGLWSMPYVRCRQHGVHCSEAQRMAEARVPGIEWLLEPLDPRGFMENMLELEEIVHAELPRPKQKASDLQ